MPPRICSRVAVRCEVVHRTTAAAFALAHPAYYRGHARTSPGGKNRPRFRRGEQTQHRLGNCESMGDCGGTAHFQLPRRAAEFGQNAPLFPCDVSSDEEIKRFFEQLKEQTPTVDLLLHSIAFAPKEALEGDFVSTTREAFRVAHDVSAYSLVALAREAAPLMVEGGSIVSMTYYGSEKVVPHYNVMGVAKASLEASTRYLAYDLGPKKIRVNCISAGPVQTLAARGISGFTQMLKHYQERAPLKRSCDPAELGATGVFMASDAAAAITGQVIYVDGGYQIMGM